MIDRIRDLERAARALEPDAALRAAWLQEAGAYAQRFLDSLPEAPAYVETADEGAGLLASPVTEEGIPLEQALTLLAQHVDRLGINPASGRFLGYIPGGGLFPSALGDFLAAVANRYSAIFFASPGAVRMENMLLDWMADVVDYPAAYGGTLTSGGSIANLVGIVTARDVHRIEGEMIGRAVVYLSEHTHHSVDKALRIAGLAGCVQRRVPVDDCYRMDADALAGAIARDQETGLAPWLVVASGSMWTGLMADSSFFLIVGGRSCAGWSAPTRWSWIRTRASFSRTVPGRCWCASESSCWRRTTTAPTTCRTRCRRLKSRRPPTSRRS